MPPSAEGKELPRVRFYVYCPCTRMCTILCSLKRACVQQDLRLVFRLQQQQFIELVRNARHSDEEDARAVGACV